MTTPMRRKDRQVEDRAEIADILNRSLVCRLGLQDEEGMYIVPLNYGYRWKETEAAPTLYFHSAPDGRKIRAIRSMKPGGKAAFEIDSDHEALPHEIACRNSFSYRSIIGTGSIELIDDPTEKRAGLESILIQVNGKAAAIPEAAISGVAVIRLRVDTLSAKARRKP